MNLTDRKQQIAINTIAGVVTILAAAVGLVAYFQKEKHSKINQDILKIEREIKQIELAQKKRQFASSNK
jgi:hypothetical protein